MTTQANVSLPNDAAVNKTFVASGVDGNRVARWLEQTASIVSGYYVLTSSMKMPSKPGDPVRLQAKLVMPTVVVETINGVNYQKIARQSMISCDVIAAQDSTVTERKDLMAFFSTFLGVSAGTPMLFGTQVANFDPIV